jgi:endoglycosylceramidase
MACGRSKRAVTTVACALLGACANGTADVAPSPAGEVPALHADANTLRDTRGRQVILRGLNHIGLRSNATRPAYRVDDVLTPEAELFDLQDLEDEDFAFIASMGFNLLRLVVTWEFAQPDPPPAPYNEAYFARIDDFLDRAAAHGFYVIFDFGQFGWSRAAGGNAGAPDWALSDMCASFPGRQGNEPPQATARVGCAFMEFWQNEPIEAADGAGVQDLYVDLWREVMRRYRDHPAVVIVDLFNEPYGALIPPVVFELSFLYPFYRRLAEAIREIDADVIIGVQPELYHSLGIPTPAPEAIGIDNALFLPHNYTVAYFVQRLDPSYPPAQDLITRADFELTALDAQTLGTPFLIGETGWTRTTTADGVGGPVQASDPTAPPQFGADLVALSDELKIGWSWFAYSSTDEAYGLFPGGVLDEPLIHAIATPFPRAIAGEIESIAFDPQTRRFEMQVTSPGPAPAEIAMPMSWQYPDGACVTVDGRMERIPYDPGRSVLVLPGTPAELTIEPC